ncbi:hypothetical protein M5X00_29545 [Paenibacillus alvei]|uniref:hypothetical protein n=1 Tax=Paenibacillus alvei TaxID=44250 RepID=UPI000287AD3E|nr:hypothetical protein [Paenibacillus alvei]EJW14025.1 hypothetical protein PAV_141p01310 [Paenibacillus alvei DSM 29]MCY9544695.1 hypothetical protein [Paenibacillus alvei]MCY9707622.1 hypothetical protein [Paenibacillus alvei]MCY9758365.1 hypothetical protein [Paenibacillus alvei]MEC0082866.1 hypothetical protein [Paenibacillus alvei]
MATPLIEVYDFFLTKVTDYTFISLNETGDLESVLYKHLRSAIVRFTSSVKDLTVDTREQQFVSTLDDFEKEILATLMTISYTTSKITHIRNMEQILSDKEYKIYSTRSFLGQLINLKKELNLEASNLMVSYSYRNGLDALE